MPVTFNRSQIDDALRQVDVTTAIEEGFVAYSQGKVEVPPVGEMIFEDPPGSVHIKYGYIKGDDYFVIKVASGFYGNVDFGLPQYDGLMLVFSQKTAQHSRSNVTMPRQIVIRETHWHPCFEYGAGCTL